MYLLQYTIPHFNAIKCVSRYQNILYVYCIQFIHTYIYIYTHTHKRTHMALSSVQHKVQSHFTFHMFLQTHFTLNWTICEDHRSNSDNVKFQKSCLNCTALQLALLEYVSNSVLNLYKVYQHVLLQGVWYKNKQNYDLDVIVQNWFGKSPSQCSTLTVIV